MPSPGTAAALSLRGLSKTFGSTVAVDHLDLEVPRGSFFGFVGPNGAGKTTTLSMATGLLRPDAGTAHVMAAMSGPIPSTRNGWWASCPMAFGSSTA